jgi:hypothetical protein
LELGRINSPYGFVIRQRGERHVLLADDRRVAVTALAAEMRPPAWPKRWPKHGYTTSREVWLPEAPDQALLLVVHWRRPHAEPLMLLVSPAARRPSRRAEWFVKAYGKRWGVEDATWGIKQRLHLEDFLVRSWMSLRRLLWLVAWVFFWLNLWGEDRYQRLREALFDHPWRLPKEVKYLFDWIACKSAVCCIPNQYGTLRVAEKQGELHTCSDWDTWPCRMATG